MSWIFVTVILTVVTGGCCHDTAACQRSRAALISALDEPVSVRTEDTQLNLAKLLLDKQEVPSFDSSTSVEPAAFPEHTPVPRSQANPARCSGTSPPVA